MPSKWKIMSHENQSDKRTMKLWLWKGVFNHFTPFVCKGYMHLISILSKSSDLFSLDNKSCKWSSSCNLFYFFNRMNCEQYIHFLSPCSPWFQIRQLAQEIRELSITSPVTIFNGGSSDSKLQYESTLVYAKFVFKARIHLLVSLKYI